MQPDFKKEVFFFFHPFTFITDADGHWDLLPLKGEAVAADACAQVFRERDCARIFVPHN